MLHEVPSKLDIVTTHERIRPYINRTPVLSSDKINEICGAEVFFKCENLQKIGAFKARGGINAALSLEKDEVKNGVCTHSSGNHAQAVALAAKMLGVKAYIVMPNNAPKPKVNGVIGLGAELIFCEPTLEARENGVKEIIEKTGAKFIHPFDNYDVIAGQATASKELLEEYPDLDAILAPVGGGGLLSGTGLSAKYFCKKAKVYAGEPEGAADAVLSFKSGKVEKAPYIKTIADGLLTNLSEKTLGIIKDTVTDILLVNDDEIMAALKLVFENLKIIIEPSCAVPLAALIKNKELFKNQQVGIILSGGNVDLSKLSFT
ncbi:threonine ammonia-lyase [Lacihabitans soyangensis]|uniref:Threonine/serine dehydratase n=1 Tax=Lacihabitans soyangensis TaxID=869394 RepID=A0AAE3KTN5_9BACT|nr:threonine/serine dehydratase [Lacihabitans soyangensis]MCP9764647.1 threonine/serine dehydratase [Lacihabitans soyangensis]